MRDKSISEHLYEQSFEMSTHITLLVISCQITQNLEKIGSPLQICMQIYVDI